MLKKSAFALLAAAMSFVVSTAAAVAGPKVAFETSLGAFTIELDEERAPKTVANFLGYVEAGHYDGVIFHRVIKDFMAQAGGFTIQDGAYVQKKVGAPIENEADNGLRNLRGAVAMARTPDPHSASAQFFINLVDNKFLDHRSRDALGWGYAVFGRVVSGMEVIDKMAVAATTQRLMAARGGDGGLVERPFNDVPSRDIVILSAKQVE